MKKIILFLLSIAIFLNLNSIAVSASSIPSDNILTSVSDWNDCGYIITTITETFSDTTYLSQARTKTGTKRADFYNAKNVLQFSIYVEGTFTYDGKSATAIQAKGNYIIHRLGNMFLGQHFILVPQQHFGPLLGIRTTTTRISL